MRILVVTSEWPSVNAPQHVPFLVEHVDRLRRHGHSVEVFAFEGKKNPLRYAVARWSLRRYLSRNRFDLIHAHWGQSGLVTLNQGLPLVLTLRGSDLLGIVGKSFGVSSALGVALRQVTRLVAPHADAVIAVSSHLPRLLPGGIRVWVIPSGIDLGVFRPVDRATARHSLGLSSSKRLILFASNPKRAEKRFDLAKAAVEMADTDDDLELLVVADAPHTAMPSYLSACDALLLTSTHEGSPNAVREALACGLPVVSTDVGDVLEMFGRLDCCSVALDDSAATLARCLTDVLGRECERTPEAAFEALSGETEVRRHTQIYVDVLRQGRAAKRARV